ncbi:MAG: filamentous hemagglutinin N-terminal domain-containing protein [Gammaproteobacteria bacterium]|nr:filamentous hemagglutinin N-terminal domain-containing protein [Gammaproteobacteria bacterium]
MINLLHQSVSGIRVFTIFCLIITTPGIGQAAEISWGNPEVVETGNSTLVRIATPNSAGVSFNRLSEIAPGNTGLEIINAASLNNALSAGEADVIVLSVSDSSQIINLTAEVNLVGKQADVIILAPQGGAISCNGCRFKAMPRLIVATGTLNTDTAGYPASIDVGAGTITISGGGMQAKDTLALDILSNNIEIDATINTQLKGLANGSEVKVDEQGDLKLASGALQIMQGQFRQNYSNGTVSDINLNSSGSLVVGTNGLISSGDIHLESTTKSAVTRITGNLTVESDRTLVSVHRGRNIIPQKRIHIRTVGDLEIMSEITGSSVSIETARSLYLHKQGEDAASILAKKVEIIAILDVVNYGVINADHFQLVADRVSNQGEIWIDETAFLSAERVLNNHLGGILIAKELTMSSHGIITNGSNKAWHVNDEYHDLAPNEQAFGDLPAGYSVATDGTFLTATGQEAEYILASNLEAVIIGQNIDIHARLMRNINPYSTSNYSQDADLALDIEESSQVLLSAVGRLIIEATEAIENTSAIIEGAESLHFDTGANGVVSNSRFQIVTDTRPIDNFRRDACVELRSCYLSSPNISLVISGDEEYFKYISPAARIIGNSDATAIRDSTIRARVFENKNSYFEIAGNLNVDVTDVTIKGTTLEQVLQAVQTTHHSQSYCKRSFLGSCISRKTKHWYTYKPFTATDDGDSLPSILLVGGTLQGQGGEFFVTTEEDLLRLDEMNLLYDGVPPNWNQTIY